MPNRKFFEWKGSFAGVSGGYMKYAGGQDFGNPVAQLRRAQARRLAKSLLLTRRYLSASGGLLWVVKLFCEEHGYPYRIEALPYDAFELRLVEG